MDVMKEWVNGASFLKICSMTSIFEGNIIRYIRRLEELLRQMSCAAKAIGNTQLETKFNDGNFALLHIRYIIKMHRKLKN
jgi:ATP-dependent RNA helicase DOB1